MEFYVYFSSVKNIPYLFQFPTGWNSTVAVIAKIAQRIVSIPNGMEFYRAPFAYATLQLSFNSQRDGILRQEPPKGETMNLFQFPTGWNSTLNAAKPQHYACVSIPNGMEFYRHSVHISFSLLCFNSQRDGILPPPRVVFASRRYCFNSQRDGILPYGSG